MSLSFLFNSPYNNRCSTGVCVCFFKVNIFRSARINNDLLLWEPTAPSPVETVESMPYGGGLSVASQLINTYSKDSFSQFRSLGPEGELCIPATLLYNFSQGRAY